MQSIKGAMPDNIKSFIDSNQIEFVAREDCEVCKGMKSLLTIKVNGEIKTKCNDCDDNKLAKELNLPTSEEYRNQKELGFILKFERITNDLSTATVNNYKPDSKFESQTKAKQAAFDFIMEYSGSESLVYSGVPGIGKSHLSYAINKAIRNKGYKTLFIKSTDLLDAIKQTYNYQSDVSDEMIYKMIDGLDLLVLDDIGGEYVKKDSNNEETWASDVLYKVIDMRLGKSLICTTNYYESELIEKYGNNGPRIVSRMLESAKGVRFEGEDQRRERF